MLELAYRVSIHNLEAQRNDPDPIKLDPPGFDIVFPINTVYEGQDVNVLWFFYSTTLNVIVVAFTGTYAEILAKVDRQYSQKVPESVGNYIEGMKMHGGFWSLYQQIQSKLLEELSKYTDKETQILITGISLGGALGSIASLDLYKRKLANGVVPSNVVKYSFASPRVFNILGAQYYDHLKPVSYRIMNGSDVIPMVPLPIMPNKMDFRHVEKLIWFDVNLGNLVQNHTPAYLKYFDVQSLT